MLSSNAGSALASGGYGNGPGPVPATPYSGFNPVLARAPYVTDLTQTSAVVNWATNPDIHGSISYGPTGSCTANVVPVLSGMVTQVRVSPNPTTTYAARLDYQSSVPLTGLSAGTAYCYEVFGSGTSAVDLLPASQPFQTFTTLDPVDLRSTTPLTFAVVGDFGETSNRGQASDPNANSPTSVNTNQAAIQSLIGSSGARFVISVGDIAYNDGGNYNYGDLQQTGASVGGAGLTEISDIFGASYWPLTGGIPLFTAGGNHGQNANLLNTWPEPVTASSSSGRYAMEAYPSIDGTNPANYPSAWYAFSSGNVRFYTLDGSWTEANVGMAGGSACPYTAGTATCKAYQVDADAHFQPTSAEYQWLVNDLQTHPGGIKLAFFHYPLRSDNATQDSDVYLQQTLEPLLAKYGVQIAFSGHAHDYERNLTAGPNTILSYVTGGGGGVISTVAGKGCSSWDAYAIGWTYGTGTGQKCGSAPAPTSDSMVYHFLKITIQGNTVVVDPINAAGQVFDEQTYTFAMPVPSAPSNVVATATSATSAGLTWTPSSEPGGSISGYQITRNQSPVTTVPGSVTSYADPALQPGTAYTYAVRAIDQSGFTSNPGISNTVTTPIMTTGFEGGTLAGWSPVVGQVTVQAAVTHGGSYAAGLNSSGGQTFALQNLPAASPTIYARAWVNVASQSTTVTLLGLRTQTTPTSSAYQVAQVYLNAAGTIKVLNNVAKASYLGNATPTPGSWHVVTFAVNESAGTLQVWLDGNPVQFSTSSGWTAVLSGQNLGSVPMSNVQLGDDSTSRIYTWYADDVTVSTVPPTP
ncbi:MAG: hypothetical protein E6I30_00590 [Chloroflexi bacterium]|nr:MAG: hypothetical protein E6I30_00590 [Chloroflexota bacterium]